uniref:Uncharacterized protein n=1 Tax=Glossina palpalis gambiensis TaxID=67801 RepID=A0A1B0BDB9_9MUSC
MPPRLCRLVTVTPGLTQFALTPFAANSKATQRISPTARCGVHLLTAVHCSATFCKFSILRPFKASIAPNFANFTAAAAPIPELAPLSILT